ncbi:MAG TPA: histidinol-phosphatase [Candidatus Limnocylindria bacterium]|nr:histidinol-phosphatase [Candidatus Limnocylindria bacterium]
MDLLPYETFMRELAEASAAVILQYFGKKHLGTEFKADESPVTVADREAERVMRELIEARFPAHGILGEEWGNTRPDAEFVWVLDPIDGTKSFITAVPLFGTLIGLLHRGKPILGCINQPVLKQLVIGNGKETTLNGEVFRVRPCPSLAQATLLTCDPLYPAKYQNGAAWGALCQKVRIVRTWGDCYGYLLVATGWADIMADPIMNPWDYLPVVPIIEGAGGKITDWHGAPVNHVHAKSIIACAPEVHVEVLRILNP